MTNWNMITHNVEMSIEKKYKGNMPNIRTQLSDFCTRGFNYDYENITENVFQ